MLNIRLKKLFKCFIIVTYIIYNILINDSGILGTVSTRIFPEIAAQGEVQPYIVYSVVSNSPSNTKDDNGEIDEAAIEVHGLTRRFLSDKPRFKEIEDEFLEFVTGTELIIHNAPFDIGFLDSELTLSSSNQSINSVCTVLDTLVLAREKHPGQRNSLDALCKRYGVDNSNRELHGALLDSEILADVYLAMTGGQTHLSIKKYDLSMRTQMQS